ncbi:hypothetical protein BH23THE1_BH23THE1_22030 [soil metagenome]
MAAYTQEFRNYSLDVVQRSFNLLDNLDEPTSRNELSNNIQNLYSASKMEGQIDIVIFTEYLINLCNGLIKGSFKMDLELKDLISRYLKELEFKIKDENHILNSDIINNLKSILKNSYREEKDFVILKNLNVLLVDRDTYSHYNIKKNGGTHIGFDSVYTLEDAYNKLQNNFYDLILCDFSIPGISKLFMLISKKIPIVVLSVSDNTRDAQIAARMGAIDYIIKNDDGMRLIQRTLHTSVLAWKKKHKEKRLLLNQQSRRILKYLISNSSGINERFDSHITLTDIQGKNFKEMIKDRENSEKITKENIERLVSSNYLSKYQTEITIACPKCQSTNMNSSFLCQNCNSSDFVKGEVMEHNKCGYSDLSHVFEDKTLDKLICPKCNKELKLIGVDYFRLETAFKCKKCTIIFTNPYQTFDCNECRKKDIKFSELGWRNVFKYTLSVSKLSEIKQQIVSLDEIENYLINLGFKVNMDYTIHSNHQSLGPFDILAQKNETTVIINSLGDDIEENFTKLFELNAIDKVITGITYKVVILFSEPKEVTRNLMANYNIISVVVDDIFKISDGFKKQFSKIISPDNFV